MSVACQICSSHDTMKRILNLGYMPPPNAMPKAPHVPEPLLYMPTELWYCTECELAQLGYVPDQRISFPYDYPYTSGATPALKKNFQDLAAKVRATITLEPDDLIVDIGSNDGTLLQCFLPQKVFGIEPTQAAEIANRNGILTLGQFFSQDVARRVVALQKQAKVITCTNCFAHMPDIDDVMKGVDTLLAPGGLFVTESHYLVDLVAKALQYDTIYAEHLRYYTVNSLMKLFSRYGMRIKKVEHITTHGGSIRVYAERVNPNAAITLDLGSTTRCLEDKLYTFANKVQTNKLTLLAYLQYLKKNGTRIIGIGAPSRGSTVISYCGLDASIIDCIYEQPHSLKLGRYTPGTDIPVVSEERMYKNQLEVEAAILFSWHLADTLIPTLRKNGYRCDIILPCSTTVKTF